MFAMKAIKGIGRRFSNIVLKIAQIDLNKRYLYSSDLILKRKIIELER
jgi:ribosomal protein S13